MSSPDQNLTIRVSAPGKVILHGEHSVVYDKLALAASLGLRTKLEFNEIEPEATREDIVSLEFPALNLSHVYCLQDVKDLLSKPINLTKAHSNYNLTHPELIDHEEFLYAVTTFVKDKSGSHPLEPKQQQAIVTFFYLLWGIVGTVAVELRQFKIKVETELVLGAGTGSSASFTVAIAAFLLQFVRLKRAKSKGLYKHVKLNSGILKTFDKAELELVSKWAFQAEKIIHGTPSGVDNTICTFGSLVEFRKGSTPKLVAISANLRAILINTHVTRDTKNQVKKVAEVRNKHKMLAEGILELMDEVAAEALSCVKKINGKMGDQFDVFEEYEKLGDLVDINHNLLRCLGVSHPKLDQACQILVQHQLHGKLTGAGGGGYALALVPPFVRKPEIDKVIEELKSKGFDAVLTDLGGDGVSVD